MKIGYFLILLLNCLLVGYVFAGSQRHQDKIDYDHFK